MKDGNKAKSSIIISKKERERERKKNLHCKNVIYQDRSGSMCTRFCTDTWCVQSYVSQVTCTAHDMPVLECNLIHNYSIRYATYMHVHLASIVAIMLRRQLRLDFNIHIYIIYGVVDQTLYILPLHHIISST